MKTTLTIVTAGFLFGLVACAHRAGRTPDGGPGFRAAMADLIRFDHDRSYQITGTGHRPDTLLDKWKFKDGHGSPTPIRGHSLPAGGSIEWRSTNCFWLHARSSQVLDWLSCANGTAWIQGANLPCPFNGQDDLGMPATRSGADWVVSLSFPSNAVHQAFTEVSYDLVTSDLTAQTGATRTSEPMVRAAATTYPCNLVVEATLVWEPTDLGKERRRGQ